MLSRSRKKWREGDRVRSTTFDFYSGLPAGSEGTVAKVAGFKGSSVYSDPLQALVFVKWDNGASFGTPWGILEKV